MGQTGESSSNLLVIEDEAKLAALLSRAFSASGYGVTTASGGIEGLDVAEGGDFGLVVLDLLLPDIDGFTVLEQLMQASSDHRVLVLSAINDVGSKVRCLEFGAVDYVSKPFELPELVARVRRHVRPQNGSPEMRFLHVGEVELDLQRRRVQLPGREPVGLSTREFLLLEYLMRREGQVCRRDELLGSVWGYSFDPGTNVVDVCVGRLRHKLGGYYIETIRNVGYCFVRA